jgi:hypothetical protein
VLGEGAPGDSHDLLRKHSAPLLGAALG